MTERPDKCAHAGCSCPAPAGGDYCSDYCAKEEDDPETGCCCGHPACPARLAASRPRELRQALE